MPDQRSGYMEFGQQQLMLWLEKQTSKDVQFNCVVQTSKEDIWSEMTLCSDRTGGLEWW